MWLIEQRALQPVHRHALIEPACHRIDVEGSQRVERLAGLPQHPQAIESLVAVGQKPDDDSERRKRRLSSGRANEPVEERDEREAERHPVDQDDLLGAHAATAERSIGGAGEQVRHPVVAHRLRGQERVGRGHVALRQFRRHRHRPDEIRREIRAIRLAVRGRLVDVPVRSEGDDRDDKERDQDARQVAAVEFRERDRHPAGAPGDRGQQ